MAQDSPLKDTPGLCCEHTLDKIDGCLSNLSSQPSTPATGFLRTNHDLPVAHAAEAGTHRAAASG